MVLKIHVQVLVPRGPDIYVLVRYLLSSTTITYTYQLSLKKLELQLAKMCLVSTNSLRMEGNRRILKIVHLERIVYFDISDVFHF